MWDHSSEKGEECQPVWMGAWQKEAELHHRVAIFERGVLQGVQLVRHVRTADVHLYK